MCSGGPEFLEGNVRTDPAMDPLGCLGDLGAPRPAPLCVAPWLPACLLLRMHLVHQGADLPCAPLEARLLHVHALACNAGWYCVRAMLWAYQWEPPTAVRAHTGAAFSERGVPLHMGATLVWPGRRLGHFECGACAGASAEV